MSLHLGEKKAAEGHLEAADDLNEDGVFEQKRKDLKEQIEKLP